MSYLDVIANQPVVIDNGSGTIKAGFAGSDAPKSVFPNMIGRYKHTRVMAGGVEGDYIVGKDIEQFRGLLKLSYPMEHGVVEDWSDMEKVWQHIYSQELNAHPEEHPVLLTEAPLNPKRNREKAAEIFFETFNVPALFVSMQAVLSLYASGRTTGVALDCGDGVTHAVPIYEGFVMPHSMTRVDVAGRDVTKFLQLQLRKQGYAFHTSAELDIVREIKEKACYVAPDVEKEEKAERDRIKEERLGVLGKKPQQSSASLYRLPDGTVIDIGPSQFRAPEVLFRPDLIGSEYQGIHECLTDAIRKSDLDLRPNLYENIVLCGGSTLYRGFGDRLLNEVKKLAPKDIKIRIQAPQERRYSVWIGGSILASLSTFKKMWVTREEWHSDSNILHKKTF